MRTGGHQTGVPALSPSMGYTVSTYGRRRCTQVRARTFQFRRFLIDPIHFVSFTKKTYELPDRDSSSLALDCFCRAGNWY